MTRAPKSTGTANGGQDDVTTAELSAGELEAGWADVKRRQLTTPPLLRHAVIAWSARTDIGRVRENNEDKFDFFCLTTKKRSPRKAVCGRSPTAWAGTTPDRSRPKPRSKP